MCLNIYLRSNAVCEDVNHGDVGGVNGLLLVIFFPLRSCSSSDGDDYDERW